MPKPLRKRKRENDKAELWNKLPWKPISLTDKKFDDFDESVLFGLEEIDGNAYKLVKNNAGYTLDLSSVTDVDRSEPDSEENSATIEPTPPQESKHKKRKKTEKNQLTSTTNNNSNSIIPNIPNENAIWGSSVQMNLALQESLTKLGFDTPTPIQAKAIPLAIKEGVDIIGAAETGSGKLNHMHNSCTYVHILRYMRLYIISEEVSNDI